MTRNMSGATVTIPLLEFQELQSKIGSANAETAKLATELNLLRASGLSETESKLIALIRQAIPGFQYAVANLGAEISAWPLDALDAWAGLVEAVVGANDSQTAELAIDLRAFARECATSARLRQAQRAGMI